MKERVQMQVRLRERNQLTIPERIAVRLEAKPGDRLLLTIESGAPGQSQVLTLKRLKDSYAGIATGAYGRTAEERAAYLVTERESWDRDPPRPWERGPVGAGAAAAPDGTPYLTFEESQRIYWQTDVTPERFQREAKLRWPKCQICGRSIARMREHVAAHEAGALDDRGVNTDPKRQARSRQRVAKWRAARARTSIS